ncbi:hypothetical protein GCM10027190_63000 [Spirosoma areae]
MYQIRRHVNLASPLDIATCLWALVKQEGVGTGLPQIYSIDLQGRYAGSAIVYLKSEGKRVSKIVSIQT